MYTDDLPIENVRPGQWYSDNGHELEVVRTEGPVDVWVNYAEDPDDDLVHYGINELSQFDRI